jgi:hypothetical protein
MSKEKKAIVKKIGNIDIGYDPESGQILRVYDRELDMEVISFKSGSELEINKLPLPMTFVSQDGSDINPAWQCNLKSVQHPSVGCSQGFDIFRQVVVGSACKSYGNHINPPNSMHVRYRLDRSQVNRYVTQDPQSAGQRPIQMPLWLDTVGTLAARTDWFGPETRMIQCSIGGCGPRSHVGLEDALVKDAIPVLWNMYRRTNPGVQVAPGAIYYHPDGRWLWITSQRPTVGMHWDYEEDALKAQFQFHALLNPAEIVYIPEVSLYWGRGGRPELMRRLNDNFIGYEEPGDWFFHTCWFWLHWWQFRQNGYDDMVEHVKFLNGELGLTGFGLTSHDLRPGAWDCCPSGLRPSPYMGGDKGLKKLGQTVRDFGGKMYVWLPFLGLAQPSLDLKESWRIKGQDGRGYESFHIESFDMYHAVNFGHPEVQAYYLEWIRRYIQEYKIDGIFWDCGGCPIPPDFSPSETRPFQRFPSESMVSANNFMEKVMLMGKSLSKDFFMYHECMGMDLPGMGYSTSTKNDPFMFDLNRAGRRRIVYQSHSTYNLYGGKVTVSPSTDCAFKSPVSIDTYRPMARDPMNKWIVKFVRENGVKDAVGLQPGAALCANHIVIDDWKDDNKLILPSWAPKVKSLTNVITGKRFKSEKNSNNETVFQLERKAAYAIN